MAYLQMLKLYLGVLSRYWSAWNVNLAIVPACSGEIKNKWSCGLVSTKCHVEARDKFSSTFFYEL